MSSSFPLRGGPACAPLPGTGELALLFAGALAARLVVLAFASHATGWAPLDLAMLSDGHADMVLSKSFPMLYVGTERLVPFVTTWRDPYAFFTRFPLYPAAIGLGSLAIEDRRLVAIAISQLAGAFAVVRFRQLAGYFTPRAALAAAVFAVFPATWLETTSLAYVEGLLVLCAISAFYAWLGGRLWSAAAWAGAAALVQKHGFVVLAAIAVSQVVSVRRSARDLGPFALALLPPAALGLYFWALSGSPFTVVARTARLFGDGGAAINWPLVSFAYGVVTAGKEYASYFWLRKALLVTSLAFYGLTLIGAIRRRDARQLPLTIWLASIFALCATMGGAWAYYYFPRYMLMGAPAAVLLAVDQVPWPDSTALRILSIAGIAAACIALAVGGTQSMWELCMHVWTPRYYEQLRPLLH